MAKEMADLFQAHTFFQQHRRKLVAQGMGTYLWDIRKTAVPPHSAVQGIPGFYLTVRGYGDISFIQPLPAFLFQVPDDYGIEFLFLFQLIEQEIRNTQDPAGLTFRGFFLPERGIRKMVIAFRQGIICRVLPCDPDRVCRFIKILIFEAKDLASPKPRKEGKKDLKIISFMFGRFFYKFGQFLLLQYIYG